MANVHIGVLNLSINGGFPSSFPPTSSNFSISQRPNSLVTSNCIPVKKSWNFDRRTPKFSTVVFGIAFNSTGVKNSWDFDDRKPKFSVIRALGNGEVEIHSTSVQLVEKDLKFSPTFQDYLKVMESVRTDRSKIPNEDVDVVTPKKKRSVERSFSYRDREKASSRGGKLSNREREKDLANRKRGDAQRRGSGWGLVERILEKKTSGKGGNNLKNAKSTLNKGLNGTRDTLYNGHFAKESTGSDKLRKQNKREVSRRDELRIHGRSNDPLESRNIDGNGSEKVYVRIGNHANNRKGSTDGDLMKQTAGEQLYERRVERRMVDFENSKNLTNGKIWIRNKNGRKLDESLVTTTLYQNNNFNRTNATKKNDESEVRKIGRNDGMFSRTEQRKAQGNLNGNEIDILEKEIDRQNISQRYVSFQDDTRKTEKLGSRASEIQGRSAKSNTQMDKIDRHEIDIEDRAAFRTFEVFTDVQNRPRVLRMELEEKIQKLAKQ